MTSDITFLSGQAVADINYKSDSAIAVPEAPLILSKGPRVMWCLIAQDSVSWNPDLESKGERNNGSIFLDMLTTNHKINLPIQLSV